MHFFKTSFTSHIGAAILYSMPLRRLATLKRYPTVEDKTNTYSYRPRFYQIIVYDDNDEYGNQQLNNLTKNIKECEYYCNESKDTRFKSDLNSIYTCTCNIHILYLHLVK